MTAQPGLSLHAAHVPATESALLGKRRTGVLIATTAGNALGKTATVHAVFGTFLVPLSQEFGWQRSSISMVLAILAVVSAIIYPLAGRYADRHGTRNMVLLGNVLFALSVACLALTNGNLVLFYLNFLAISLFGSLPATSVFSRLVAEWFDKNRGTALGISAGLGNGIGSVCVPIMTALIVSTAGWRAGYLGIGALILCVGFPIFFFLLRDAPRKATESGLRDAISDRPAPLIEGMTLRQAIGTAPFWLILIAIAAGGGTMIAVLSHVVPILADRGYGLATGTAIVSLFALTGSLWQIFTGRVLDKSRGPRVVVPMYALAIVGLLLLEFSPFGALLPVAGLCLGIALGAQFGALPYYIARYFGLRSFGVIIGVMYSAVIGAQGITPVLMDLSFDLLGHYRLAVLVSIGVMAVGSLLLFLLPAYADEPEKVPASGEA
ncbi:MAG: MFS transporter [Alphaproteobacteria bacterium]|nr:MFS transporter [Alphaproteobacteria bacterium]MBU0793404.1 MFS transporter [Alphaproteobacteria bacterium]MBU0877005.1 MFS transporter [Alphaproteobacteria bacterium]MBU1768431.1 MFS transporter [Alphaproteobacteria bacterium]